MGQVNRLAVIFPDNAIKYTHAPGEVKLMLKEENRRTKVIDNDSGPGIPREEQEKIFERFYRVDKSSAGQTDGARLGLSLAKQIAQQRSGDIAVQNLAYGGCRFTASIPKQSLRAAAITRQSAVYLRTANFK